MTEGQKVLMEIVAHWKDISCNKSHDLITFCACLQYYLVLNNEYNNNNNIAFFPKQVGVG